jgi:hypothetical protein
LKYPPRNPTRAQASFIAMSVKAALDRDFKRALRDIPSSGRLARPFVGQLLGQPDAAGADAAGVDKAIESSESYLLLMSATVAYPEVKEPRHKRTVK